MTASGIDTALRFRHLFILRRGAPPSGPRTAALVEQFRRAGGKFIAPTDDDLRAFAALAAMDGANLPDLDSWLRQRRPLFQTHVFREAGLAPPPFLSSPPPAAPEKIRPSGPTASGPSSNKAQKPQGSATERVIPIGRRYADGALGELVQLKAGLLSSHIAILAGTGSGKTVLLRRIVEEAAMLGIPAIVLDPNNDLSRLGDAWPSRPETWSDEEAAKARAYYMHTDVVIWTPGVTSGCPISLDLLPDFAVIGDKQDKETADERAQAVEMARATLEAYIGGTGQKPLLKKGVLADALRAFAMSGGGTLDDLIG
ncbi:MAG: helicase HerA domain-containing protein, partial [Pseudomonadota bacterium]